MKSAVFLLALTVLAGCKDDPVSPDSLPADLQLSIGESGLVLDKSATFTAVLGDSRCPRDVQCVWAGDAEVEVVLREGTRVLATIVLHTNPGAGPSEVVAEGLRFRLVDLTPYPDTREPAIEPGDYVATVRVEGA